VHTQAFRGRKCTHKHLEEGSAHTSIYRKEVHTQAFRGRKCTHKHLSEGSANAGIQRMEVHTQAFIGRKCMHKSSEEGGALKHSLRMDVHASAITKEGSASTCTQSRKLHAYAPRRQKMRNEARVLKHLSNKCCATSKEVQHMEEMQHTSRGRRCNLCLMMRSSWVSVDEIYSRVWMRSSRLVDEI
jgi:hypothetical protein